VNIEPTDDSLDAEHACIRLRVSKATLYRLLAAGELRSYKIGSRRFILGSECDAFIRRRIAEASQ
jgi:excisionase family DNA binding protein